MKKILFLLITTGCFALLFTPCYAMELDKEPELKLGKRPLESNNDAPLNKTKKISEKQLIKQDWSLAPDHQQQTHPPLALWEQFLTSLSDTQRHDLFTSLDRCVTDFPLAALPRKMIELLVKFSSDSKYYDDSPQRIQEIWLVENFPSLKMLYNNLSSILYDQRIFDNLLQKERVKNGVETERWFFRNYFAQLDFNLDYVNDKTYFSTWRKAITITPFPAYSVSEEVKIIIKDEKHPQFFAAESLNCTVSYIHAYLFILYKSHQILYKRYISEIPHFQTMLSAGYQKNCSTWKCGFNKSAIPPTGYYFLSDYPEDCPIEWLEIYDLYSVLGRKSTVKTEKFKSLLDLYHSTKKSDENIAFQIETLKKIVNYVDNCNVEKPFIMREKIQQLESQKNILANCLQNLENIEEEISPQQLQERITLALSGSLLLGVAEKLNIDLENINNFTKETETKEEILNCCNEKYAKLSDKIDVLRKETKNNEWEVLQDLRGRAQKKINFLKKLGSSREKAERIIENSQTELLPLWPFMDEFLTFLDPLKRENLEEELLKWQDLIKADAATIPNFFLWLDNVSSRASRNNKFLVDDAKVHFRNGLAYNTLWTKKEDQPLEGIYLYYVSPDRSLYIAPENKDPQRYLYKDGQEIIIYAHRDIAKEPWAIGAGQMIFRDGKIIYINRQSGHFIPETKHLNYTVCSLEQKYGKDIFGSDLMIDNSLTTEMEIRTPTDIMFSRNNNKIWRESYDMAKFREKNLCLFDLGFKD